MSKQEPVEPPESNSSIGDPRIFRFAITCRICKLSYYTLQSAKLHFTHQCPHSLAPKIRCGCCGTTFRNWGSCASHLNVRYAHLMGPTGPPVPWSSRRPLVLRLNRFQPLHVNACHVALPQRLGPPPPRLGQPRLSIL